MKNLRLLGVVLLLLTYAGNTFSATGVENVKNEHYEPIISLLISGSGSDDKDSSKILGAEIQLNWRNGTPFTVGFHGMYQNQEYGQFDGDRFGLGLSINHYFNLYPALKGLKTKSWMPYVGIKKTWYFGIGSTQEALDCLMCSNIDEDYSGGEAFLTAGMIMKGWTLQVDWRITDERSEWSKNAYDPWGVGPSFSASFDGIPDPEIILHIGYSW